MGKPGVPEQVSGSRVLVRAKNGPKIACFVRITPSDVGITPSDVRIHPSDVGVRGENMNK
jgi:hypothetical protein